MRHRPRTLKEARNIGTRLDYETKDGGVGTEYCPNCREKLFVVEGHSSNGVVGYSYCVTPGCGYERSADEAKDDALDASR